LPTTDPDTRARDASPGHSVSHNAGDAAERVRPHPVARRTVPDLPTAQPVRPSVKQTAASGTVVAVDCRVHVAPRRWCEGWFRRTPRSTGKRVQELDRGKRLRRRHGLSRPLRPPLVVRRTVPRSPTVHPVPSQQGHRSERASTARLDRPRRATVGVRRHTSRSPTPRRRHLPAKSIAVSVALVGAIGRPMSCLRRQYAGDTAAPRRPAGGARLKRSRRVQRGVVGAIAPHVTPPSPVCNHRAASPHGPAGGAA